MGGVSHSKLGASSNQITAQAVTTPPVWDGSVATSFFAVSPTEPGSASNPYLISTGAELAYLAQKVNTREDNLYRFLNYKLTADIVLNDTSVWENWDDKTIGLNAWPAIGNYSYAFEGVFDGNGHTVSGIYASSSEGDMTLGLFGKIEGNGTVKNVGVLNSYIRGDYVGGVVGYNRGGKVINCYNNGVVTGNNRWWLYAGGVVGENQNGEVINCYNSGAVSGAMPETTFGGYVGGVVGGSESNGSKVTNCYNSGAVSATFTGVDAGKVRVGGVVGYAGGGTISITNCYNSGAVNATGTACKGGVVGNIDNGTVTNCYFLQDGAINKDLKAVGSTTGTGTVTNCSAFNAGKQLITAGAVNNDGANGVLVTFEANADLTATLNSGKAQYNAKLDPNAIKAVSWRDVRNAYPVLGESVTIVGTNIYANGTGITLKAVAGHPELTNIYYKGDLVNAITLTGLTATNGGYDLSGYTVYGGGDATATLGVVAVNGNTSITMEGGKVTSIYGGGNGANATVTGNTTITISGGIITGNVVGGGNGATTGTKTVNISGAPTIGAVAAGIIMNGGSVSNGVEQFVINGALNGSANSINLVLPSGFVYRTVATKETALTSDDVVKFALVGDGATSKTLEINADKTKLDVVKYIKPLAKPILGATTSVAYTGKDQADTLKALVTGVTVDMTIAIAPATAIDFGEYTITVSIDKNTCKWVGGGNENLTFKTNITQATNSINNLAITGWTYGAAASTPTATAAFGTPIFTYSADDITYSGDVPTNAGTYWVKASVVGTNNYAAAELTKKFTIAKAPLTVSVSASPITKVYDGNANASVTLVVNGLKNGETATAKGTETYVDKNVGSPKNITVTDIKIAYNTANVNNYEYTQENLTPTGAITAKDLTVVWKGENGSESDFSWVYSGAEIIPTAKVDTGIVGETITLTVSGGQINVSASASATAAMSTPNTNYNLLNTTQQYTITHKGVTKPTIAPAEIYSGAIIVGIKDVVENAGYTIKGEWKAADVSTTSGGYLVVFTLGGNYCWGNDTNDLGDVTINWNITPLTATLEWSKPTATDLIYDGNAKVPTATVTNLVSPDTCEVLVALNGGDNTNVGTFTYKASALGNSNYALPTNLLSGDYTITARPIAITAGNGASVYGEEIQALTSSVTTGNLVKVGDLGTLGATTTATKTSNVGNSYTTKATFVENNNYIVTLVGGTYEITKRPVTITAGNGASVYGNDLQALTSSVTTGTLVNGTDLGTLGATTTATKTSNVGNSYTTKASYTANNNYVVTLVGGTYTITARPITITANPMTKVYGEIDPKLTHTITSGDLVSPDTLTGELSRATGENVGTYAITSTLANPNYEITFAGAKLTITQKALTADMLNIGQVGGVYSGSAYAPNVTVADGSLTITATDDYTVTWSYAPFVVGTVDDGKYINAGTYTATVTATNGNYSGSVSKFFTIKQKELTVTAKAHSITYGAAPSENGFTTDGLLVVDNKLLDGKVSFTYDYTQFGDVGIYTITPVISDLNNYLITRTTGILTVNPKAITVKADDKTSVYGASLAELTFSSTAGDIENGDKIELTLTKADGTDATTYAISGEEATESASNKNKNYVVTVTAGTYTITSIAVTIKVDDQTLTYGAAYTATYTLTNGAYATGESVANLSGLTNDYNSTTMKDVNATAYVVSPSGNTNTNYNVTYSSGNLTINKKDITAAIVSTNKEYDGNNTATIASYTFDTLVYGDVLTLENGTLTFSDKNAGTNKAVTATSYSLVGDKKANYNLTGVTATNADIAKKALTVTANSSAALTNVYDGNTTYIGDIAYTTNYTLNKIDGDEVTLTIGAKTFDSKDVATATKVTIDYSDVLVGLAKDNYSVTAGTFVNTATITPKELLATMFTGDFGSKEYTGSKQDPTFGVSDINGGAEIIDTSDYSVSWQYKGVADANPGFINAGTYTVKVTPKGNYTTKDLENYSKDFTITARPITITADAVSKVYGTTTDPELTYKTTSGSLVSPDTLTGELSRATGENVGTYAITSTLANPNYAITYISASLTITRQPIALPTIANKPYTGSEQLCGLVDTTEYTVGGTIVGTNRGDYTATVTPTGNYMWNDGITPELARDVKWSITNANPTVSVTIDDVVYGTIGNTEYDFTTTDGGLTSKNYIYTATGVGSDSTSLAGTIAVTYTAKFDEKSTAGKLKAGEYIANWTFKPNDTTNYTEAIGTQTFNVTQIKLAPAIIEKTITKVYDGTTTATVARGDYSLGGLIDKDVVALSEYASAYASQNVVNDKGLNNVTVTYGVNKLAGADAGNYLVDGGTLTYAGAITAKPLDVVWDTTAFTYNGVEQKHTASVVTGISGESVPVAVAVTIGNGIDATAAGATYTETASIADTNYSLINNITNTYSIAQKEVSIVPTLETITYGDTEKLTGIFDGVTVGEITEKLTVKYTTNATTNTVTSKLNAGTFDITEVALSSVAGNQEKTGNYVLKFDAAASGTGKLVVNKKTLTVAAVEGAVVTKSFDGSTVGAIGSIDSTKYVISGQLDKETPLIEVTDVQFNDAKQSVAENDKIVTVTFELKAYDVNTNYTMAEQKTFEITGHITSSAAVEGADNSSGAFFVTGTGTIFEKGEVKYLNGNITISLSDGNANNPFDCISTTLPFVDGTKSITFDAENNGFDFYLKKTDNGVAEKVYIAYCIDKTIPTVGAALTIKDTSDTSKVFDGYFNSNAVTVSIPANDSLSGLDAATTTLTKDGNAVAFTYKDGNIVFNLVNDTETPESEINGTYILTVSDNARNKAAAATFVIAKHDFVKPTIGVNIVDGKHWLGATTLNFKFADENSGVKSIEYTLDGKAVGAVTKDTTEYVESYKDVNGKVQNGKHVVTVKITDTVGNYSTYKSTVYIDTIVDDYNAIVDKAISSNLPADILAAEKFIEKLTPTQKEHISGVEYVAEEKNEAGEIVKAEKIGSCESTTGKNKTILDLITKTKEEQKDNISQAKADAIKAQLDKIIDGDTIKDGVTKEQISKLEKDFEKIKDDKKAMDILDGKTPDAPDGNGTLSKINDLIIAKDAAAILNKKPTNFEQLKTLVETYEKLTDKQKAYAESLKTTTPPTFAEEYAANKALKEKIEAFEKAVEKITSVTAENYIVGETTPITADSVKDLVARYDEFVTNNQDVFLKMNVISKVESWKNLKTKLDKLESDIASIPSVSPTDFDKTFDKAVDNAKTQFDGLKNNEKDLLTKEAKDKLNGKIADNNGLKDKLTSDAKTVNEIEKEIAKLDNKSTAEDIAKVKENFDKLNDTQKGLVTNKETLTEYVTNNEAVKDLIKQIQDLDLSKKDLTFEEIKTIVEANKKVTVQGQKDIINNTVGEKLDKIIDIYERLEDAKNKIESIPTSETNKGGCELCDPTGTKEPTHDTTKHLVAIEDAKIAIEKLSTSERELLGKTLIDKINSEYDNLKKYLEKQELKKYIKDKAEDVDVYVYGLATKVDLSGVPDIDTVEEVTVSVNATKTETKIQDLPEGKENVVTYNVKLLAKAGNNLPYEVQPTAGQTVVVKLPINAGVDVKAIEIYHISDNGNRVRVENIKFVVEDNTTYAIFGIESFSEFAIINEKKKVDVDTSDDGSSGSISGGAILDRSVENEIRFKDTNPVFVDVSNRENTLSKSILDAINDAESGKVITVKFKEGEISITKEKLKDVVIDKKSYTYAELKALLEKPEITPTPTPTPTEKPTEPTEPTAKKCWLCGACPMFLGICLWIWLAIAVVAVAVVVFIVVKKKKKNDKK